MNKIIYLASYPKSGNTWFRTFITNLINEKEEDVNINNLKTDGIYSSRSIFDSITGLEASDLTNDEIDYYRPRVYNKITDKLKKNLYIKVHDAYTVLPDGLPLIGTNNVKAVYIIRNPLDVVVSFANHSSKSLDETIKNMGDTHFEFCKNKNSLANQLRQKLLTWGKHAESWADAREIDVHVIRYEDMKLNSLETFYQAVKFMELDYNRNDVEKAIKASDFNKLKEQENSEGFKERPSKTNSFFRKGEVGDWRNHLNNEQINRVISDHRDVMIRFGYLDKTGNPIF